MTEGEAPAVAEYCREIEAHLCRKNDGHLIRVTGPSFDLVAGWAATGVPLKVAFRGIDRYFERYYRTGTRRRPVRIDFCEADVQDVFDEWRRAVGLPLGRPAPDAAAATESHGRSLPGHLERVLMRLTSARAGGAIDDRFDAVLDGVSRELDLARGSARGLRGAARQELVDRLAALDRELLDAARAALSADAMEALTREAHAELSGFRAAMTEQAFDGAVARSLDALVRERLKLPTLTFA